MIVTWYTIEDYDQFVETEFLELNDDTTYEIPTSQFLPGMRLKEYGGNNGYDDLKYWQISWIQVIDGDRDN